MNPKEPLAIQPNELTKVIEPQPDKIILSRSISNNSKPWSSRGTGTFDFAERDVSNRRLEKLGEDFVLNFDKQRLNQAERDDLARKAV